MRAAGKRDNPLPGHGRWAARSWPREAFIPPRSPYLGQTIGGEPVGQSNVLFPNRRDS
jgi:hypothetical protein